MGRLEDVVVGIIILLPVLAIIGYWYVVYCLWNALLFSTAIHVITLHLVLFVILGVLGIPVTIVLLILFFGMLSAL